MKKLMLSTALGAMTATGAFAEAHISQMDQYEASDLMGQRVYAGDAAATSDDWNDIGEIDDILVTMSGDVPSMIVGVGGFLGIGEKDVALGLDRLSMVTDDGGNMFLVVDATQEELEQMEEYESTQERAAEAATGTAEGETEMAEGETEMAEGETEMAADAETADTPMATMPAMEREGYANVTREELTTEDLTGARVYDVNDTDIGEINSLIVDDSGMLTEAIIDVGGFLGLGEKQVAMSMDAIQIMRNAEGGDVRIYVDQTQEQLEAMQEYEG